MRLPRSLQGYLADARGAFRQAPIEICLGFFVAVTFSARARMDSAASWDPWVSVATAAALAAPLVFALTTLYARRAIGDGARWAGTAAVLAAAVAFHAWFDPDLAAHGWRFLFLGLGLGFVLLLTPALPAGPDPQRRARVWSFGFRLLRRLAGVLGYAVLLHAALAGAVAAVVGLFELSTPRYLYMDLIAFVYFALAPLLFVGGTPRLVAAPDPAEAVSPLLDVAVRYFFLPVLGLYAVILYAYTVKVVVTGEVPQNLLSPLVLGAAVAGFLAALLAEPFHADPARRGTSLAYRAFPAVVLPLLPLAAWAVYQRVHQYGWTEFRYARAGLLAAVALLAVVGTVRLLRRRPPVLTTTLASFAALFLLSAAGPWSAPDVSRRDQTARLWTGLRTAGLDGEAARRGLAAGGGPAVTLDSAALAAIVDPARYLATTHGKPALASVFPGLPSTLDPWMLATHLGLEEGCAAGDAYQLVVRVDWAGGAPLAAGGRLHPWEVAEPGREATAASGAGAEVRVRLRGDTLEASGPGWRAAVPLGASADSLASGSEASCRVVERHAEAVVPLDDATYTLPDGRGTVLLRSWVYRSPGEAQPGASPERRGLLRAEGYLLLRE
jgi:hypothetical protein